MANWKPTTGVLILPADLSIDQLAGHIKRESWLKLPVQELDFSQVKDADSSILATILVWAQQADNKLKLRQLPAQLLTLVELYDLQESIELID